MGIFYELPNVNDFKTGPMAEGPHSRSWWLLMTEVRLVVDILLKALLAITADIKLIVMIPNKQILR